MSRAETKRKLRELQAITAGPDRPAELVDAARLREELMPSHECPVCNHECAVLERDLATFMQTGSFHPDAVRGTKLDSGLPANVVADAEQQGFVVGVKGTQPEPYALARELRQLADLVDREGQLRDTERARRLGLAVARALGPRWSQRGRMLEEGRHD